MSIVAMMLKGIALIALALFAFAALASALGYQPIEKRDVAECMGAPKPMCLFTIL